ncbi:type II secretion system F family protein [Zobellella sp. An-6]|uniref:type II secretion system F family protein n=1 Tax=Zobellella sp. An-6 TaxID=3400218 RepID=UPI0040425B94
MAMIAMSMALLVLAVAMVLFQARRQLRRQALAQLDETLQASYRRQLWHKGRTLWSQAKQPGRRLNELALLLRQAGVAGSHRQLRFLCLAGLLWLGLTALAAALIVMGSELPAPRAGAMVAVAAAGVAYVMLIALRLRVRRRAALLEEELLLVLQVMRILWEVGMSLESLLRVLIRELTRMAPESCKELGLLLARIEAGEDREQTLNELAMIVPAEGWQDMLRLLAQVSASGGGMSEALQRLTQLLQDRRRTQLQETVSKLSGRMSAVMMVFLFPALLLVLAGPGFLALIKALGNMG